MKLKTIYCYDNSYHIILFLTICNYYIVNHLMFRMQCIEQDRENSCFNAIEIVFGAPSGFELWFIFYIEYNAYST